MKINELNSDGASPTTPLTEDEYTYRSPTNSEQGKRRSYDKSYRTHEPLKGLPEVEFEEKPWDVTSDNTQSPVSETKMERDSSSVEYALPYNAKNAAFYQPRSPAESVQFRNDLKLERPETEVPYYAEIDKDKKKSDRDLNKRLQSQTSLSTAV